MKQDVQLKGSFTLLSKLLYLWYFLPLTQHLLGIFSPFIYYIFGNVCMYVRYRRPRRRSDRAEILHGGGLPPRERHRLCLGRPAPTSGRGWPRSASGGPPSPHRAFLRKLYKTKVGERPRFSGGGSGQIRPRTSPKWPGARPSPT